MKFKLRILSCRLIEQEIRKVIQKLKIEEEIDLIPFNCGIFQEFKEFSDWNKISKLLNIKSKNIVLIGSNCFKYWENKKLVDKPYNSYDFDHCYELLIPKTLLQSYLKRKSFILTSGGLNSLIKKSSYIPDVREKINEKIKNKFNQFLLLDTGIDERIDEKIKRIAEDLGLKYEIVSVGLDFLKIFIKNLITEMKLEKEKDESYKKFIIANQKSANYEMAFDLISSLITSVRSEEKVIKRIIKVFSSLFAFDNLIYTSFKNNKYTYYDLNFKKINISEDKKKIFHNLNGLFKKLEGNKSFILNVKHANTSYGIIYVKNIHFSEHIDQYLNIALLLSKISGLAISNARNYERLEKTLNDLKMANEELIQFNYSVSHDLRQPLATITGYANLLQEILKGKIKKEPQPIINEITKASNFMDKMIEGLLKFSQIGKNLSFELIELDEALQQAMNNLKSAIDESEAKIIHEDLPEVHADRIEMITVFQNLIDNAIKYSGEKAPEIQVKSKEEDGKIIISIRDNGLGISSEEREKIFDLFYRGSRPSGIEGAGIGLSTCRKIIKRHNGKIWVKSHPNDGTTFYFSIPKL